MLQLTKFHLSFLWNFSNFGKVILKNTLLALKMYSVALTFASVNILSVPSAVPKIPQMNKFMGECWGF